jgi:hypothetical protein
MSDSRTRTLVPSIQGLRDSPRILVLTVEDTPAQWLDEVDSELVKSRISEQDLSQSVTSLLHLAQNSQGERTE